VGQPRSHSLRESPVQYPAAISGNHVLARALRRTRTRSIVVYVAVCAAARRLGDVVRRALSDRPVRVTASFSHPSAQRDAVRGFAEDAHVLAYLLFLAFVAHFGAILFHTLIVQDGMLSRMAPWRARAR
jgi:cytochrome b561